MLRLAKCPGLRMGIVNCSRELGTDRPIAVVAGLARVRESLRSLPKCCQFGYTQMRELFAGRSLTITGKPEARCYVVADMLGGRMPRRDAEMAAVRSELERKLVAAATSLEPSLLFKRSNQQVPRTKWDLS